MCPALLLVLATTPIAPPPAPDISVPAGFVATLVADNPIAPDIYTMTIDDAGRVLVAGRGYVRVLVDGNGDGIFDRAIDLIDGLKDGPMGLFAEGESLYVVVDGGLQHYRGYNGKDKLKAPKTILKLKTTGEHDAHAVRRGPDGWLYLLCGNQAGVSRQTITSSRSPVKEPVAGTLLRISPDRPSFWGMAFPRQIEVVADGFRNAYSFDFNLDGEPFTYDSDNERCVGLPWYEPCRFYHIVPGGNYGWRSPQLGQFWRKPPYFVDCVPPVCYLGRGSPTGVAAYRHSHFPEKYRGGFFLADWTFGRIHYVPLTAKDSTYQGKPEVFAEAIGTSGFAPTALAVHPTTGELLVSIGGRGTRGGVYRISFEKGGEAKPLPMAKRSLEWTDSDAKRWLADCTSQDTRLRRTTLELMTRAGLQFAWTPKLKEAVRPNLSHPDPLVRIAAARTLKPLVVPLGTSFDTQTELAIALVEVNENPTDSLNTAIRLLRLKSTSEGEKLQALRIIQLALGDLTETPARGTIFEGYTLRKKPTPEQRIAVTTACDEAYLAQDPVFRHELFRTLACIQSESSWVSPGALRRIDAESRVENDISYLAMLSRLGSGEADQARIVTGIARCLVTLEKKVADQKSPRDTFWPLRISEVATALGDRYPTLAEEVARQQEFGRPEHLLLVEALNIPRLEAATRFMAFAATEPGFTWTPGVVELMGALPEAQSRFLMLRLWDKPGLRDSVVKVLSIDPKLGDERKFIAGLESFDPKVVTASAEALLTFPELRWRSELVGALKALQRLPAEDKAARSAVAALLEKRTKQKLGTDTKRWLTWVAQHRSDLVPLITTNDGFDAAAWKKRQPGIPWDQGNADRGKAVFAKASCAACHDGGRALGPSLLGISKRFGREDLLTSILQPSKDVSPRYRPVRITTNDDKVFIGMLIYEATDGVILQTSADTSVRIAGETITAKRPVESSLMPANLLDKLSETEVADLFAYLSTLAEPNR